MSWFENKINFMEEKAFIFEYELKESFNLIESKLDEILKGTTNSLMFEKQINELKNEILLLNKNNKDDLYEKIIMEKTKQVDEYKEKYNIYLDNIQTIEKLKMDYKNSLFDIEEERKKIKNEQYSKTQIYHNIKNEETKYLSIQTGMGLKNFEQELEKLSKTNEILNIENLKLKSFIETQKNKYILLKKQLNEKQNDFLKKINNEENILNEKKHSLYEFYFYVKYNKRKNRSIRECIEKHKNCEKCTHIPNPNKFFSFNITSQLITILEKIGCENIIYFDEKNCCDEMSKKKILYCISYM